MKIQITLEKVDNPLWVNESTFNYIVDSFSDRLEKVREGVYRRKKEAIFEYSHIFNVNKWEGEL